jgi:hypothetical protein
MLYTDPRQLDGRRGDDDQQHRHGLSHAGPYAARHFDRMPGAR